MKTLGRSLLFTCLALASATSLVRASVPIMEVKVSNEAGKLVFSGKTDQKGLFATKQLEPGDYVVQFNCNTAKGGPYALVVSAGKKKVVANSVSAGQFTKGGVAMKLPVEKLLSVTGQISDAGQATTTASNGKTKYVNGKKFVWVPSELGSNLGGRWEPADSAAARNIQNTGTETLTNAQSRTSFSGGSGN